VRESRVVNHAVRQIHKSFHAAGEFQAQRADGNNSAVTPVLNEVITFCADGALAALRCERI
jgi:hypothetical protein